MSKLIFGTSLSAKLGKITAGRYLLPSGDTVQIAGPHPRWPGMVVSDAYDFEKRPGDIWWDTGIHPFGGPCLVARIDA